MFKRPQKTFRMFTVLCLLGIAIAPTIPLIVNPIETKTTQIPYSSYLDVPQYWFEANEWLNNQTGDFRVLLTPLDDYYQMPYVWGYYGTDSFFEELIQKPVVSASCLYAYKINKDAVALINQLRDTIDYNRTTEFESILSFLNVRYVLQRNDIDYEYLKSAGRNVHSVDKMQSFLLNQTDIKLVKQIGALEIYKLENSAQTMKVVPSKSVEDYNADVIDEMVSSCLWDFDSANQLDDWSKQTLEEQFDSKCTLSLENGTLRFEIMNSTWGWKVIGSPWIPANPEAEYNFIFDIKGENAEDVHGKIFEYDNKMQQTTTKYVSIPLSESQGWTHVQTGYSKVLENTAFIQLQIWSGHATNKPLPNKLWIDNVEVQGSEKKFNVEINSVFDLSNDHKKMDIIEYERISATKIQAKINVSEPALLMISEAYDPNWEAHIDGKAIQSTDVFSINGFEINQSGEHNVIIEYKPQQWLYVSFAIAAITLLGCIDTLVSNPRSDRERRTPTGSNRMSLAEKDKK